MTVEFVLLAERAERAVCMPMHRVVVIVRGPLPPQLNRVLAAAAAAGVMVNRTSLPRTFTLTAAANSACLRNALEQLWLAAEPAGGRAAAFAMPAAAAADNTALATWVATCPASVPDDPDPEAVCGADVVARDVLCDLTRTVAFGRTLRAVCAECRQRRAAATA